MAVPLVVTKNNPRKPFIPYPAQRQILTDPSQTVLAVGGVAFGKTATASAWLLAEAWRRPGKYLAGAPTYPMLRGALWETLVGMVHPALVKRELRSPQLELHLRNGSIIIGRTLSKPESLQGLELSGAAVDEAGVLPDAEAIRELLRRLRQQGGGRDRLYLSANPAGHNWMWELFVAPPEELEDDAIRAEAQGIRRSLGVHRVTTFQNPFLYDDYPICKRSAYIERLWHSLTPRARRRWLLGGFDDFSGSVYDAFDPDRHVVEMPASWKGEWPAGWQLISGADFGFEDPWATIMVLVEPNPKDRRKPTYWGECA